MPTVRRVNKKEKRNPVDVLLSYLDYHLASLYDAMQENDQKEIDFNKVELEEIRVRLVELSYFKS